MRMKNLIRLSMAALMVVFAITATIATMISCEKSHGEAPNFRVHIRNAKPALSFISPKTKSLLSHPLEKEPENIAVDVALLQPIKISNL